jgi:hypothetical protein
VREQWEVKVTKTIAYKTSPGLAGFSEQSDDLWCVVCELALTLYHLVGEVMNLCGAGRNRTTRIDEKISFVKHLACPPNRCGYLNDTGSTWIAVGRLQIQPDHGEAWLLLVENVGLLRVHLLSRRTNSS